MLANIRFEEVSNTALNKVLSDGRRSSRIDVVFDIYQVKSIKTAERAERGSKLGIVFRQIKPGHRIKNWKRILASIETKAKLAKFMTENWKELRQREKLGDVILMVTSGERCLRLTKDDVTEITELRSTQEEADTRMMIHVKHAATSYQNVVMDSEDTDVFVNLLSLHSQIPTRILLRRGKGNAVRLIEIPRLRTILGEDVCQAMIDVHWM